MTKKDELFLNNFHIPRWSELPNIDLYLDQVVTLINSCLSPYIFLNDDYKKNENELLTKTMINNYVKNNLIAAPVKKQYSKKHLARLFVICVLKQVYSMQDISNLINITLKDSNSEDAYNNFCDLFEEALICTYTKKDFIDKHPVSNISYLLKTVLLSCSYKIYVQNTTHVSKEEN